MNAGRGSWDPQKKFVALFATTGAGEGAAGLSTVEGTTLRSFVARDGAPRLLRRGFETTMIAMSLLGRKEWSCVLTIQREEQHTMCHFAI